MAIMMQFFLPVIPDSAPIVIPVNQYDYDDPNYAGRLVFNLIYEGQTYDMTGATASIQGTKPDGTVFAYDAAVSGSIVRAKLTQQMTAVYGRTVGNLIVMDADNNRIGTFAFWLEVQKSAIDGTADPSETEIPELIALATAQAQAAQQSATEAASSADAAAAWSGHPPYIGLGGTWYVYNVNTELYEDSGVDARGRNGTVWYNGTAITGKSTTPTAYATGIPMAYVNDMYLSIGEGAIYACTTEGNASTALWVYKMTLSGGGGATVLTDLQDVTIAALANGQILQYDNTSGKWKNVNLPALSAAISTLTDVNLTDLANGQILQYNGVSGKWENASISPGGASALTDLNDVAITSVSGGQILQYDSTAGKWKNASPPTVDQTYNGASSNAQSGTAVAGAIVNKADITDLDSFLPTTATVSSGTFSFSGLDDTQGYGYKPYIQITSGSTNLNPTAQISSITGAGTSSMTVNYTTDANNGSTVKMRVIK